MRKLLLISAFGMMLFSCTAEKESGNFSDNLENALADIESGKAGIQAPLVLFDFEDGFNLEQVELRDMEAELVEKNGSGRLRLHSNPHMGSASITIKKPEGAWDLNGYFCVKMDITNLHDGPIQLILQVGDPEDSFEGWQMQEVIDLEQGETKTVTDPITVTPWLFSSPLELVGIFGPPGQTKTDLSNIGSVRVSTRYATEPQAFEIDNIRAEGAIAYVDTTGFLPFVDRYGQFKHTTWPGKINSDDDLDEARNREDAELLEYPEAPDRSIYGGWTAGPRLEATGFFRTAKVDGIWWLVDPEGYLFWSNGVVCVHPNCGNTGISGRDAYFEELPEKEGPFGDFWGRRRGGSRNFYLAYGAHDTYNFSASNLKRKYGENWKGEFNRISHARLRSWGMNTIAMASDRETYMEHKTPYVAGVWVRGTEKIEASSGYQGKFHDVFHPSFRKALRESLAYFKAEAKDPWCLGFFIENELSWGRDGSLASAILASPASQTGKKLFLADLKAKYRTIGGLNVVWGSDYKSWEEMLEREEEPDPVKAMEDLNAFYQKIATTYFSTVREEMKAVAPDILYLGCRLAWANSDIVVRTAAEYCDVISYNKYEYNVGNITLPEGVDKPILIGEYHFGALDRGSFHVGIKKAESQEHRGEYFNRYVESALGHPHIVGAHWFQYGDQAVTGRGDGENYNVGLLTIGDTPHWELIDSIRHTSYTLYNYRISNAK